MVRNYINTIWDMEEYAAKFYNPFYSERAKVPEFAYGIDGEIRKADAPVISTTTGWWNYIYGKKAWLQILLEANAFSILPRIPYTQSGWRVITAAAATSGGGVTEHGAIPDTTKPTWVEVKTKPKTMAIAFDASEVATFLGTIDDAIGDPMVELRPHMSDTLIDLCDRALLTDADTLAAANLESLDRVVGSYSEITGVGQTAGDLDIYGLDRDAAATWADAYVNHASDVDRDLQLSHLDSLIQNCGPYWSKGGQRVFLTGWDTYERIAQLIEQKQRIVQMQKLQLSVNGVKTVAGHETGFDVCSYRTIPIVKDLRVPQDTLSRIYLLDLGNIGLKVAKPIQYFESGMRTGDPFALGKFGDEGMFRLMGELICNCFKAQGKVRDLK